LTLAARLADETLGVMPQVQLPVFPHGSSPITPELAFERKDKQVVYFNGHLPVFTHEVEDLASFRLFTTQLIVNGTASHGQISRAFGVPLRTVKRCVKRYRHRGAPAFFQPTPKRQGQRLTPERLAQAQGMLDAGRSVPEISAALAVLATTLHKAIDHGRLKQIKKKNQPG
jgi:transposase